MNDKSKTAIQPTTAPAEKAPAVMLGVVNLLLLVTVVAAAYIWIYQPQQMQHQALAEQLQQTKQLQSLLQQNVQSSQQQIEQLSQKTASDQQQLYAAQSAVAQQLVQLRGTEQSSWRLSEVEYLLRLAQQRVQMQQDAKGAVAILRSADKVLLSVNDGSLHAVRALVAQEIASLNAVPRVDYEGLYLQLAGIAAQVTPLPITVSNYASLVSPDPSTDMSSQGGLADLLKPYFSLRKRNGNDQALPTADQVELIKLNLQSFVAQAQAAVLKRDGVLFRLSLTTAKAWLRRYFPLQEPPVQQLLQQIDVALSQTLATQLPEINGSLALLRSLNEASKND